MIGPPDLIWPQALGLLACLDGAMGRYAAMPCRSFVAPGGPPAWDVCCECDATHEGQAWVQIGDVAPTDNFPTPQTGAMICPPAEWAVSLTVAILRCAHSVNDSGEPPSAAQMTGDAEKVQRDRAIIDEAIRCCFLADAEGGTYSIGAWTPLGPIGGCVGGQQTLTIAAATCRCTTPEV